MDGFGCRRAVAEAVEAWLGAIADRAVDRVCAMMTEAARRQLIERLSARDVGEAVARIADALGPQARDELRRVIPEEVTFRDSEVATVRLGEGQWELGMCWVGGRWIVSDLMSSVRVGAHGFPPMPSGFDPALSRPPLDG